MWRKGKRGGLKNRPHSGNEHLNERCWFESSHSILNSICERGEMVSTSVLETDGCNGYASSTLAARTNYFLVIPGQKFKGGVSFGLTHLLIIPLV